MMTRQDKGVLYTPETEKIFSQLPGLVLWEDLDQRFLGLNQEHLDLLGYRSLEQALGKTVYNLPCKACELAETFSAEERAILNSGEAKTLFGIIGFNNEFKAMMTFKKPLIDHQGKIVGLFIQGFDVTEINLLKIADSLIKIDSGKGSQVAINQFEYELINSGHYEGLSQREIECLFFLIRGKSAKETARLLNISYRTVEHHIDHIKNKLNCRSKSELICTALESGFSKIITPVILTALTGN